MTKVRHVQIYYWPNGDSIWLVIDGRMKAYLPLSEDEEDFIQTADQPFPVFPSDELIDDYYEEYDEEG